MANETSNMEGLGISVQTNGVDQSIKSFERLSQSIEKIVGQVDRLSKRITVLMRKFTQLNKNIKGDSGTTGKTTLESSGETFKETAKEINVQNLVVKNATVGQSNFNKQLKATQKQLKGTGSAIDNVFRKIRRITYIIGTVKLLTRSVSSAVKESGTWIENLNLFAVTFGESRYGEVLDWATEYADKLGVANTEIVQMTGLFKQLSTAIGITGQTGDELAKTLTQLGYDLASFYNVTFESAFEKLQSGIYSGQVRTLRSLGIDVSQASIQNLLDTNEALKALNLSATTLSQTDKVLARVVLTMQTATNAFGDMARSIDTLQNRQRILTASLQNLRLAIGDALAEPAREFMAYGIAIVQSLTQIIRAFVPLKTELEYDIGENVFTEITEDVEETQESLNQLSFDKFQSLSSKDNAQINTTEALIKLLEQEQSKYEEISSQFDGIDERVNAIKESVLGWIFPNATIEDIKALVDGLGDGATFSEKFNVVLAQLNPTLHAILNSIRDVANVVSTLASTMFKITQILAPILAQVVTLLDTMGLLKTVIVSIIILKFGNSLYKTVGIIKTLVGSIGGLNASLKTGMGLAVAFVASFTIVDKILSGFSGTAKIVISAIMAIVSAGVALWTVLWAIKNAWNWVTLAGVAVAGGVLLASIKGISDGVHDIKGYETGGIPEKSELFYMNEHGIPEAIVNTGGRETNVINQQQLGSLVQQGFERAIYSTGLLDAMQSRLVIEGNGINDSAFARAIFPALKTESNKRGGNQL